MADVVYQYCAECHDSQSHKGGVDLTPVFDNPSGAHLDQLHDVYDVLTLGQMPPEDENQLAEDELAKIVTELSTMLSSRGREVTNKLTQPGYGNYVDHDLLFTEPEVRKAATDARIWRYNVENWIAETQRWTRNYGLFQDNRSNAKPVAFPYQGPDHTFLDWSLIHDFGNSTTEMLLLESDKVARTFMQREGARLLKHVENDKEKALSVFYYVVNRDHPTRSTLDRLAKLHADVLAVTDETTAYQTVFQAIICQPAALYRFELGDGTVDEHGRRFLASDELLVALGFAMSIRGPSPDLKKALEDVPVSDREQIAAIIDEQLETKEARERLLQFMREYFEYPRALEVFKDADLNDYHPDRVVDDADQFVLRILDEDEQVLRKLLTDNRYYIHGMFNYTGAKLSPIRKKNGYKDYHDHYNLPREEATKDPVWREFPDRAGILTHPAWLLAFSDNLNNQAIQRGRWVTTNLLGGYVPDAPVEVDARLPDDDSMTLREKMHVTRAVECRSCHDRMDPVGLPFEQYNLFGKHRTTEKDRPVDTTGELWGEVVTDPLSYVNTLADSEKVRQVFIRHVFRFFMGRNETLEDAPTLIDMDRAYTQNKGSLKAAVRCLLTSDSFLLRRAPDVEIADAR